MKSNPVPLAAPLKILYCTDVLAAGGVERQLTELVTRLDRTRFDPQVLCLYGEKAGFALHFAPRLRDANIPLHVADLRFTPQDKLRGIAEIIRSVWQNRPAIVQAMNYHGNLFTRMARPFLPPRLTLIGTVRGKYTPRQLRNERLSQAMCTRIIVNSPALQSLLIEAAHVAARKVLYIPNGVDVDHFAQTPDSALRERLAPGARRVLVSIGRISSEKQMHRITDGIGLLKTQNQLPDGTRLIIVGSALSAQAQEMQRLLDQSIATYDLREIVTQCPDTTQPEAYYHAADATILFSPAEGMPNVVLESLAAGRPVIVSEAANASGIIEEGVTGWIVRTGDRQHLAETLHRVLTLPDADLAAFRERCIARAQDFAMTKMVARYEALYTELLRRK